MHLEGFLLTVCVCVCVCVCACFGVCTPVYVCNCVTARLTCAGLLVLVQSVSLVAVAGEDARRTDADLFTVVFPLSTQVNG